MTTDTSHGPMTADLSYEDLRAAYGFLSGDQERLERTRREALAEVEALRALVKDIAEEVFPSPEVRAMLLRDGQGWRKPMMRAAAGMAIAEPVVVAEESPEPPMDPTGIDCAERWDGIDA